MKTILIIGSGKLAQHLNHWFNLIELTQNQTRSKILNWDRHQDPRAIHNYVSQATHVWLAISDAAIIPFYEKYLAGHDVIPVHFSGALHDERLISTHPLMSFSHELYPNETYQRIQFALTGAADLQTALPGFKNSFFTVAPGDKPLYHALCVMAGNFPQMLWNEIYQLAEKHNIPAEAFNLYLQQITKNFIQSQAKALTGPFARKDISTIEKNIQALQGTSLQPIYQSFQKEFLK